MDTNQKEQECNSRGIQGKNPGKQGGLFITVIIRAVVSGLKFACDSTDCYLGHVLAQGASVSSRHL